MNSSIFALMAALGPWNWLIAAAILLAIELAAPGMFMLWLGIAAFLVGALSFAIDWPWQLQILAFALVSLALIPAYRHFAPKVEKAVDQPFLNRRAEAFVGKVFTLDKPITNGAGTIRIDDTVWRVTGADCGAGMRVRVTRTEGATLYVEPA
jgi:membrane protein implicated in regulation of membrane protease activity